MVKTMPLSIIVKQINASASQRVGTGSRKVLGNCFGTRSATASTRYENDTLLLQERCFQKCTWATARQLWGTPTRCAI